METFNIEFSVFSLFVKQTWKMKLFCKCHNWDFKMVQAVFLELVWKKSSSMPRNIKREGTLHAGLFTPLSIGRDAATVICS